MFLLHEYDIFWTFLIITSLIPILVFWISGLLAPVSEGPEKLSSYESGIVVALERRPQPGGVVHPSNPRGWLLGEVQTITQIFSSSKNTRTLED